MGGAEGGGVDQLDLAHAGQDGDPGGHGGQEPQLVRDQVDLDRGDGPQNPEVVNHQEPVGLLDAVTLGVTASHPVTQNIKCG